MGLTADDIKAAIEKIRADNKPRPTPSYGIPKAGSLSDETFRRVGLMDDEDVARLAHSGIQYALVGEPMHPQNACAIRVAYARSGSDGPEQIYNKDLVRWVTTHLGDEAR